MFGSLHHFPFQFGMKLPIPRIRTAVLATALGGSAFALTGCNGLTDGTQSGTRIGAINIAARNAGEGHGSATATMIAFDVIGVVTPSVPNSAIQQSDQCVFASVDTARAIVRGQLSAGTSVAMMVGPTYLSLQYSPVLLRYATSDETPFIYSAGDVARVVVPGTPDGFPSSEITVKLAEPLVVEPVTSPSQSQSLIVRWNGTNDPSSAIIFSLRYANPPAVSYANEQIYCALRDDGVHEIAGGALLSFLESPAHLRSVVLTRWRSSQKSVADNTLLHIVSSIDTTVTVP